MLKLPKDVAPKTFHKQGTSLRRKLARIDDYLEDVSYGRNTSYIQSDLVDMYSEGSSRERLEMVMALSSNSDVEFELIVSFIQIDIAPTFKFFALSPSFNDETLMDLVHYEDDRICASISMRSMMSQKLQDYLIKCAEGIGAVAVLRRFQSELSIFQIEDLVRRAAHSDEGREAVLRLSVVSDAQKCELIADWAARFSSYADKKGLVDPEMLSDWSKQATERAFLVSAHDFGDISSEAMINELSARNWITPSLLIRSVLSGHKLLFSNIFARLSQMPVKQVEHLFLEYDGRFFAAAYERAGLPKSAIRVVAALISKYQEALNETAQYGWADFASLLGRKSVDMLEERFGNEIETEINMINRLKEETISDYRKGVMSEYLIAA